MTDGALEVMLAIGALADGGLTVTVLDGHADTCGGDCPRWIGTGLPTCRDHCECDTTKANAPDFVKERGNVQCWWKTRVGRITSRCPCWGAARGGKPGACCSHHSANPRYILVPVETDPEAPEVAEQLAAIPDALDSRPADADSAFWHDGEAWGSLRTERKPYVRRWPAETLVCPHDVPAKGIHCQSCCEVFATDLAFGMHRHDWTQPCRRPEDLIDVDTGVLLVYQDNGGAWAINWAANAA